MVTTLNYQDEEAKVVSKSSLQDDVDDFGSSKAAKVSSRGCGAGPAAAAAKAIAERGIGKRGKDQSKRKVTTGLRSKAASMAVSAAATVLGDESAVVVVTPAKNRRGGSASPSPPAPSSASAIDITVVDAQDATPKHIVSKILFGYSPGRERVAVPCSFVSLICLKENFRFARRDRTNHRRINKYIYIYIYIYLFIS